MLTTEEIDNWGVVYSSPDNGIKVVETARGFVVVADYDIYKSTITEVYKEGDIEQAKQTAIDAANDVYRSIDQQKGGLNG